MPLISLREAGYRRRWLRGLRANDAKALLRAALAGFGIVLVAESLAREALGAGQLVQVLPDWAIPSRPMHILTLAESRPTPKLRSFVDAAVLAFGPRTADSPMGPVVRQS